MTNDKPVTITQADEACKLVKQFYPEMRDNYNGRRVQLVLAAWNSRTAHAPSQPTAGDCNCSPNDFAEGEHHPLCFRNVAAMPSQHSDLADRLEALHRKWLEPESTSSDMYALRSHLVANFDVILSALRQRPDTVRRDAWEQAVKAIQGEQERLYSEAGDYLMDPNDCIEVIRALATKDAKGL